MSEPLVVVDKSPAYAMDGENLLRMDKAVPEARYLHLLRHPRGQGESIMNVAKGAMAVLANSIDYATRPPVIVIPLSSATMFAPNWPSLI